MLIASKSDHDPMVHGVKSKIRKKNAGKSSSCPEYAQASVQIPREDQPMILGPDQTIGGIYRLFRKCSGGADGGVLGVNGSIRPSCLDKGWRAPSESRERAPNESGHAPSESETRCESERAE